MVITILEEFAAVTFRNVVRCFTNPHMVIRDDLNLYQHHFENLISKTVSPLYYARKVVCVCVCVCLRLNPILQGPHKKFV